MKVLCLADNTSKDAWGEKLSQIYSKKNNLTFRGKLEANQTNLEHGCYHIGPLSMQQKDIIDSLESFDHIVLVDQDQSKFSHSRIFLAMWKLVKDIRKLGYEVKIENRENMEYLDKWEDYFLRNKSFCANPWILMHDGMSGNTNLCGRNWKKIKQRDDIKNWQTDPDYSLIREKMLKGEEIPGCGTCYTYEKKGIRDMRWTDSFDWITHLRLESLNDFKKIKKPAYYEVRPSNKCNLKCRMCSEGFSHLIENENKQITDKKFRRFTEKDTYLSGGDSFNKIDLDEAVRVYVAGGEPTIMPEFYEFLRFCVREGRTNLELKVNTNAVKISQPLFDLFKQFKDLWFTCSIDGTGKINEYIRWGTDGNKQIENIHKLRQNGAGIHFIFVTSIYNVHNVGDCMHFFDREFPYATVQINCGAFEKDLLSPFNHPDTELVLASLKKAKSSKCYYHQERGSKPMIDGLYDHYSSDPKLDVEKLKNFFYYNDTLDKHRGSSLAEYIPQLERCRKYILD
jgi:hypothetical protein